VNRYHKAKTNLDFTEARDSEWQWHQLGHMQVCTSFQTDNHASTTLLKFFTGRMRFLPPNQQRQSTEGNNFNREHASKTEISETNVQSNLGKGCIADTYCYLVVVDNNSSITGDGQAKTESAVIRRM